MLARIYEPRLIELAEKQKEQLVKLRDNATNLGLSLVQDQQRPTSDELAELAKPRDDIIQLGDLLRRKIEKAMKDYF